MILRWLKNSFEHPLNFNTFSFANIMCRSLLCIVGVNNTYRKNQYKVLGHIKRAVKNGYPFFCFELTCLIHGSK